MHGGSSRILGFRMPLSSAWVDRTAHARRLVQEGNYCFLSRPRRFGRQREPVPPATCAAMIIRCASEVPATISSARASRSSRSAVVPRR